MKLWRKAHYEKLMGLEPETQTTPTKSVFELQTEIQALQERIREIQSKCTHPVYSVMFWSWRPGAMQPAHICGVCNGYLGEATKEESELLWKNTGFYQGSAGLETGKKED